MDNSRTNIAADFTLDNVSEMVHDIDSSNQILTGNRVWP